MVHQCNTNWLAEGVGQSRDHGVQVQGDVRGRALSYAAGLFNGAPDLATGGRDLNDGKDVAVRVFGHPLRGIGPTWLGGLGVGLAASTGTHEGLAASAGLPAYRSPGQQSIFAYRTDADPAQAVVAAGRHTRLSPQAYLYAGRIGVRVAGAVLVRHRFVGRAFFDSLADLSLAVSPVMTGLTFLLLFGRSGWLQPVLERLGVPVAFAWPRLLVCTLFVTLPFTLREVAYVLEELGTDDAGDQGARIRAGRRFGDLVT